MLFALPNVLPASVLDHLPGWYQQSRINLGLDLRGGAHFLLEADLRSVLNERLANLSDSVRARAAQAAGRLQGRHRRGRQAVVVTLRDEGAARQGARGDPRRRSARSSVSGSGDTIRLAYSDQDLTRRKKEVIDQSIEILRRRVDETGTIEPTIVRQGDDRILLQVPGIKDTTELKRKINQTAKLTFHLVNEDIAAAGQNAAGHPAAHHHPGADARGHAGSCAPTNPKAWDEIQSANPKLTPEQICRRYQPQCLPVFKRVVVGGEDLDDAKATFENQQNGGRPIISFTFNAAGGRAFCAATRANIGKRLAIQLDNEIISAPVVQSAICGGSGIITGSFTTQQTQEQALLLRSGALPATLTIIEERTVGADLGADAIHSGTVAALVGTAAGHPLHAARLRAGVRRLRQPRHAGQHAAGVRRHVDPGRLAHPARHRRPRADRRHVGRFQRADLRARARGEGANGRSPFSALATGYERALTAVIDSNLTALIAGVLLFGFGSGPIRGFATSLTLGLLTHLFTATIFTRMLLATWVRWRRPTELPI